MTAKSAGKDFQNHLRSCMHHLNVESYPAGPDVWMRPAMKAEVISLILRQAQ